MRKVYLEPNTDEEWGGVVDLAEGAPVQCWRTASQDVYPCKTRCNRGCAALFFAAADEIAYACCLALHRDGRIGQLVDAPPEEDVAAPKPGLVPECAERIVAAIEYDLRDRRGLKHEWNGIDPDVQDEIRARWASIVRAEMAAEEG